MKLVVSGATGLTIPVAVFAASLFIAVIGFADHGVARNIQYQGTHTGPDQRVVIHKK